jgi:hypothetical protein
MVGVGEKDGLPAMTVITGVGVEVAVDRGVETPVAVGVGVALLDGTTDACSGGLRGDNW